MGSALYARSVNIGGGIAVYVPTVGEIIDNEEAYYESVYSMIATPYDMMVQLDDAGIDFTKINDYDLFTLMFPRIKTLDTSLIFGDLDLRNFHVQQKEDTGDIVIRDPESGIVIDRVIHNRICECLRKMLNIPRVNKRPGNEEGRKYMIERARVKLRRQAREKKKQGQSQLETYVIALVNTEQFPYNYMTVRDVTIFQFYASLKQIVHKIQYDNVMIGYYAGTVKLEDLKQRDRTWIQTE